MAKGPTHYRISTIDTPDGLLLSLNKYEVYKETPQGYWVVDSFLQCVKDFATLKKHKRIRWVSKTSTRRFCYPDVKDAINSFLRRRHRYISRLEYALAQSRLILQKEDELKELTLESFKSPRYFGNYFNVGEHELTSQLIMDV